MIVQGGLDEVKRLKKAIRKLRPNFL